MWIITATLGLPDVDRAFDREIAHGTLGQDDGTAVPVTRVSFAPMREPDELRKDVPAGPWRCRSIGIPVAPFAIVDEAVFVTDELAAYSGRRIVFWFFGWTRWATLKLYWIS